MLATMFVAWFSGTLAVGACIPVSLTPAGGDQQPAAETWQYANRATVTAVSAPVFVLPDARRVPLRTLKQGDAVEVLEVREQWVQIAFEDPQFGRRVAFIERRNVALSRRDQSPGPPGPETRPPGAQSAENRQAPSAAPRPAVIRNGYVSVNAGYQATKNDFTGAWQFTVNQEASSAQVRYPIGTGAQIDVSGGARVWRDLIVGGGVSRYTRATAASASADVAHPLYFSQMRHVEGDSSPLTHSETALHMHAMWMFAPVRKLHIGVFGGPTVMRLAQTVVTGVQYTDSYPYDTAAFSGVTTASQTASKLTANVGADVAYMLTPMAGLGAVVRFSRATIPLTTPDGGTLNVKTGGLQGGVGLRFTF